LNASEDCDARPYPAPRDDIPSSAAPIIISESPTHVVIAAEISKAMLVGYRRLFEQLTIRSSH
jgi:hypothetical protein